VYGVPNKLFELEALMKSRDDSGSEKSRFEP